MKKISLICLISVLVPSVVFGESARFKQLVVEKQRKMEQLEKCTGSAKGLMIAGLSTLGLTAVGVAGNIAEAKIIDKNNEKIEKNEATIERGYEDIRQKRQELFDKEMAGRGTVPEQAPVQGNVQGNPQGLTVRQAVEQDIAAIQAESGKIGGVANTHGYVFENLPESLGTRLASTMISFMDACDQLVGKDGILTVKKETVSNWQAIPRGTLKEDDVLTDLNEHLIGNCKIETCDGTHNLHGNTCVAKDSDCTTEKQAEDENVVSAVKNGENCEVIECKTGFKRSQDKTKCVQDLMAALDAAVAAREGEDPIGTRDMISNLTPEEKENCIEKVKSEAFMKWGHPNYSMDGIKRRKSSNYAIAVADDTEIYNKWTKFFSDALQNDSLVEDWELAKPLENEVFFKCHIYNTSCKAGEKLKDCNINVYACMLNRKAEEEYKKELTQTICGA